MYVFITCFAVNLWNPHIRHQLPFVCVYTTILHSPNRTILLQCYLLFIGREFPFIPVWQ